MADANPKVMDMIRAELKKNPDIGNKELFDKAKSIDKSVGKLNPRQFNARYPLQVKRATAPKKKKNATPRTRKGAARGGRRPAEPGRSPNRDRVRTVMLELARDVANAQGKGDVVDVIMGIDGYVDRVIKAAG